MTLLQAQLPKKANQEPSLRCDLLTVFCKGILATSGAEAFGDAEVALMAGNEAVELSRSLPAGEALINATSTLAAVYAVTPSHDAPHGLRRGLSLVSEAIRTQSEQGRAISGNSGLTTYVTIVRRLRQLGTLVAVEPIEALCQTAVNRAPRDGRDPELGRLALALAGREAASLRQDDPSGLYKLQGFLSVALAAMPTSEFPIETAKILAIASAVQMPASYLELNDLETTARQLVENAPTNVRFMVEYNLLSEVFANRSRVIAS